MTPPSISGTSGPGKSATLERWADQETIQPSPLITDPEHTPPSRLGPGPETAKLRQAFLGQGNHFFPGIIPLIPGSITDWNSHDPADDVSS